jgi:alpha-glucoside transport system substrate-binding protein
MPMPACTAAQLSSMTGPFTDADAVIFAESIKGFEEATGIDIQYEGSKEFEATITIRLDGGDRPDIVDFPQPGLLAIAAAKGQAIDMETVINPAGSSRTTPKPGATSPPCKDRTVPSPLASGRAQTANRFVFYPKAEFDAAGYTVPETWDELMALTEEIAADGDTPWCIGMESGAATGWTMTDWIEDVMLRTTSPRTMTSGSPAS